MGEDEGKQLSRRDFIKKSGGAVAYAVSPRVDSILSNQVDTSRNPLKEDEKQKSLQEVLDDIKGEIESAGGEVDASVWVGRFDWNSSEGGFENASIRTSEILHESEAITNEMIFLYANIVISDRKDVPSYVEDLSDALNGDKSKSQSLLDRAAENYKKHNPQFAESSSIECFNQFLLELNFSEFEGLDDKGKGRFTVSSIARLSQESVEARMKQYDPSSEVNLVNIANKYQDEINAVNSIEKYINRHIFKARYPFLGSTTLSEAFPQGGGVSVSDAYQFSDSNIPESSGEIDIMIAKDLEVPTATNSIGIFFWSEGIDEHKQQEFIKRIYTCIAETYNAPQLDALESSESIKVRETLKKIGEVEEIPLSDISDVHTGRSIYRLRLNSTLKPLLVVSDDTLVADEIYRQLPQNAKSDLVATLVVPQVTVVNAGDTPRPKNFTVSPRSKITPELSQNKFREGVKTDLKYVQFSRTTVGIKASFTPEEAEIVLADFAQIDDSNERDFSEDKKWLKSIIENKSETDVELPSSEFLSLVLAGGDTVLRNKIVEGTVIREQVRNEVGFNKLNESEQEKWHNQSFNGLGGYVQANNERARLLRGREYVLNALCAMDLEDRSMLTMTLAFDVKEWDEIYKSMSIFYPEGYENWPTTRKNENGLQFVDFERMYGRLIVLVDPGEDRPLEVWCGGVQGNVEMSELVEEIRDKHDNPIIYFGDQNIERVMGIYENGEYKFAFGPGFDPGSLRDVYKQPPYSPLSVMPVVHEVLS